MELVEYQVVAQANDIPVPVIGWVKCLREVWRLGNWDWTTLQIQAARQKGLKGTSKSQRAVIKGDRDLVLAKDNLDEAITTVSDEVETHLVPFAEVVRRLDAIPGINQRGAEVVIAELGIDMAT